MPTNWGLLLGVAVLIAVLLLPTPAGLPVAAYRMLAVLCFRRDRVDDGSHRLCGFGGRDSIFDGLSPRNLAESGQSRRPDGHQPVSGSPCQEFADAALALVASALFLAAAMVRDRPRRRIALVILSRVGTERGRWSAAPVWSGLSWPVRSVDHGARRLPGADDARHHCGVQRRQKRALANLLIIATVQTASIWNVGIKTAAAQNMVAVGFIEKTFRRPSAWLEAFG